MTVLDLNTLTSEIKDKKADAIVVRMNNEITRDDIEGVYQELKLSLQPIYEEFKIPILIAKDGGGLDYDFMTDDDLNKLGLKRIE